jgi:hypothetical protein
VIHERVHLPDAGRVRVVDGGRVPVRLSVEVGESPAPLDPPVPHQLLQAAGLAEHIHAPASVVADEVGHLGEREMVGGL